MELKLENGKVVELSREDLIKQLNQKTEELKQLNLKQREIDVRSHAILDSLLPQLKSYFVGLPQAVKIAIEDSRIRFGMQKPDKDYDTGIFDLNISHTYSEPEVVNIYLNYYTTMTDINDSFELIRLEALGVFANTLRDVTFIGKVTEGYKAYWKFGNENYVSVHSVTESIKKLQKQIKEINFKAKLVLGVIFNTENNSHVPFYFGERSYFYADTIEIIKINAKSVKVKYKNPRYEGEQIIDRDWMERIFNKIEEVKKIKVITKDMV